ncbi:MAG: hypothetical protein KAW09_01620 [Thermoplasmata archaeon]|nr:hypothetical protein [Thermoplasmata archaeon]
MDDFSWKVLSVVARKGYMGATREDFFKEIRGVQYKALEEELRELENEGNVQIEWTGPNKFIITITTQGSQLVGDEYKKRIADYTQATQAQAQQDEE